MSQQEYKNMRGDDFSPRLPSSTWNPLNGEWDTNIEKSRVNLSSSSAAKNIGSPDEGDNFLLANSKSFHSKKDKSSRNYKTKRGKEFKATQKLKDHNRKGYDKRASEKKPPIKPCASADPSIDSQEESSSPLHVTKDLLSYYEDMFSHITDSIDNLPSLEQRTVDFMMGCIETLVLLGIQIMRSNSIGDVVTAGVVALKSLVPGRCLLKFLKNHIYQIEPEANTASETISDVSGDWSLLTSNASWKHVSYTISAVCSIFVADWHGYTYDIGSFNLIKIPAMKEQQKAGDLVEAILKTLEFTLGAGSRCLKDGSLRPLLYERPEVQRYEEEYSYIQAHCEVILNGNIKTSVDEFEKRVQECIKTTAKMKLNQKSSFSSEIFQKRYHTLVLIAEKIVARRKSTNIKETPIGFSISGDTSVGKSTVAALIEKQSLVAMGLSIDPIYSCVLDAKEAYQSSYTTDILAMRIDDFGNGKANFTKENPCDNVLKFFNCVAATAIKAELADKGVTFIEFKTGSITTNVKDLMAPTFSNCPESILRRFFHVSVRVQDKFCMPNSLMLNEKHPILLNSEPDRPPPDVWWFDVEVVETFKGADDSTRWRFVPLTLWDEKGLPIRTMDIDLPALLRVVNLVSKQHDMAQKKMVTRSQAMDKITFCPGCSALPCFCTCIADTVDNYKQQILDQEENFEDCSIEPLSLTGLTLQSFAMDIFSSALKQYTEPFKWIRMMSYFTKFDFRSMATNELSMYARDMASETTLRSLTYMPDCIFTFGPINKLANWWAAGYLVFERYEYYRKCRQTALAGMAWTICFFVIFASIFPVLQKPSLYVFISFLVSYIYTFCATLACTCRARPLAAAELARRRDGIKPVAKEYRDGFFGVSVATVLILSAIGIAIQWNKAKIKPQTTEVDEASPGWMGRMLKSVQFKATPGVSSQTATTNHLVHTLQKNLWFGAFELPDGSIQRCCAFIPRTSVVMFPEHVLYPGGDMTKEIAPNVTITLTQHTKSGGKRKFKCDFSSMYTFPDKDLVAAFFPNSPSVKSCSKWLSATPIAGDSLAVLANVDQGLSYTTSKVHAEFGEFCHTYRKFVGFKYTTEVASSGTCMSMLIKDGKAPVLMGFHIGGDGVSRGRAQAITLPEMQLAFDTLSKENLLGAETGEMPKHQYGKEILTSNKPHPKSAFASLDNTTCLEVVGQTPIRSTMKSKVTKSILSDAVEEVFKKKNTYHAPDMNPNWKSFNKSLAHLQGDEETFFPDDLRRASDDYIAPLLVQMDEYVSQAPIKPLSLHESIMGIDGKRFIDAVNMNTSCGPNLFCPKRAQFTEVVVDGVLCRIPSDAIVAEMKRLLHCYAKGERGFPMFSSCLKDEPTDNEKVRVFQCLAVAYSLLVRMMYLPLVRFIGLHPITSECAVGMNAFGPEWSKLMEHVESKGKERTLAWDYSKYDLKMSSQMTREVMRVHYLLAERGGYSKDDLRLMDMMSLDLCHPLVDWNGTLILLPRTNPSGVNITVQNNSIAGSIYVRMGFFSTFPEALNFRDHVAAATYGDDFKGTVDKEHSAFNFFAYQKWCSAHNKKITPPDKEAEAKDFDPDADFLKRKSSYIPEIGTSIGAISRDSLFKSLFANLESSVATDREIAFSCIETTAHEVFAFGREEYDDWMTKLKLVSERVDLPCPILNVTFDERVDKWKNDYIRIP